MVEKKMKTKERKSPSQKKVAAAPTPKPKSWPNLPFSFPKYYTPKTHLVRKNITGLGVITKSWISPCCIRQTLPQLVEINVSPEYRNNSDNSCFYGNTNKKIMHINLGNGGGLYWDRNIPLHFIASVYPRSDLNKRIIIRLVVTGVSSPAFAWNSKCGYNDPWKTRDCTVTEPYSGDGRCMEFTNVIGFEGKFYAISRQGSLALIEDEGNFDNFMITDFGKNRAVPYCKESRHFREYLLEYDGDIYLVFLLSRVSINKVDGVEVLRLDTSRLSWKKVDRLKGGAIFFVEDNCCLGISARVLLGCSSRGGNCVYFTHDRADDDSWFVFDMETSCISPTTELEVDI